MKNYFFDFLVSKNLDKFFTTVIREPCAQNMRDMIDKPSSKMFKKLHQTNIVATSVAPKTLEETISNRHIFLDIFESEKVGRNLIPTTLEGSAFVDLINIEEGTEQTKRVKTLTVNEFETQKSNYVNKGIMHLRIFAENPDLKLIGEHNYESGMKITVIKESTLPNISEKDAENFIKRLTITCEKNLEKIKQNVEVANTFSEKHAEIIKDLDKRFIDCETAEQTRNMELEIDKQVLTELKTFWLKEKKNIHLFDLEKI